MRNKLSQLSLACLAACMTLGGASSALAQSAPPGPPPSASDQPLVLDTAIRKQVAEELAAMLANKYAHADLGEKMAQVIRAKIASNGYEKITSPHEFALALQTDARSVANDRHLRVTYNGGSGGGARMGPPRSQNGAIRRVQILPGNIGYMEVNGVPNLTPQLRATIAAAFAFLHDTDALIIDVRGNGGGSPETVAFYMSYLSEGEPYTVNTVQMRSGQVMETKTTNLGELSYGNKKPLYVLTSSRTFSGGEEFSYDVQAFKRGTLVGETTGGGANPTGPSPLSHGFVGTVPFGYAVHPVTKTNWEGVGVKPEVDVPAEQALVEAQRLAIEQLKASATDPAARTGYEVLAQQLQARAKAGGAAVPNQLKAAQLVGSYTIHGNPGPEVAEKGGQLYLQHPPSSTPRRLIPLGGDLYRLEGMSEDFTATFGRKDGQIQLVAELGSWPPLVAEKAPAQKK